MTSTPTPTYTPTVTDASDSTSGHAPADAVDVLSGGPNGQNGGTYWLAAGQALPGAESSWRTWSVNLGSAQTINAVQLRLALAQSGAVNVTLRLLGTTGNQLHSQTLFQGTAVDNQVIGTVFPTPVPGARQVYLIFTESPSGTAPGLRTVGVYAQ